MPNRVRKNNTFILNHTLAPLVAFPGLPVKKILFRQSRVARRLLCKDVTPTSLCTYNHTWGSCRNRH